MYIIAIGWLYVAVLMAATEHSVVAGLMTFVFYGLLPCAVLLYLMATPARRRRRAKAQSQAQTQAQDGTPDAAPQAEPPVARQ